MTTTQDEQYDPEVVQAVHDGQMRVTAAQLATTIPLDRAQNMDEEVLLNEYLRRCQAIYEWLKGTDYKRAFARRPSDIENEGSEHKA